MGHQTLDHSKLYRMKTHEQKIEIKKQPVNIFISSWKTIPTIIKIEICNIFNIKINFQRKAKWNPQKTHTQNNLHFFFFVSFFLHPSHFVPNPFKLEYCVWSWFVSEFDDCMHQRAVTLRAKCYSARNTHTDPCTYTSNAANFTRIWQSEFDSSVREHSNVSKWLKHK